MVLHSVKNFLVRERLQRRERIEFQLQAMFQWRLIKTTFHSGRVLDIADKQKGIMGKCRR